MLVLVTGGSASGKSEMAEAVCQKLNTGRMVYIATMIPYGEEGKAIVTRHRRQREAKGFDTIERYRGLTELDCSGYQSVLLECMSNLVANEMFDEKTVSKGEDIVCRIMQGVRKLQESVAQVVVVSNEVFADGVIYSPETMAYIDVLGQINREIAGISDVVVESVCGLSFYHKGRLE